MKAIMDNGEANACEIWKGYGIDRNRYGWFYKEFGGTDVGIGANLSEALGWIEAAAEECRQER
jgi:hypothetical protein